MVNGSSRVRSKLLTSTEERSSPLQVIDPLSIGWEFEKFIATDWRTNSDFDSTIALVQKLADEQRGSCLRMNQTDRVEKSAISTSDVYRHDSHVSGEHGDPGCAGSPARVSDGPLAPLKLGYLASREDYEHATA